MVGAVIADLKSGAGRALVHVGADQPAEICTYLRIALNEALGARGTTFELIEPVAHEPIDQAQSLRALIADMQAGQRHQPGDHRQQPGIHRARHFGLRRGAQAGAVQPGALGSADETARATTWFVPKAHEWESWSDARAYEGTVTILQPQALPFYRRHKCARHARATRRHDAGDPRGGSAGHVESGSEGISRPPGPRALAQGVVPGTASAKSEVRLAPRQPLERTALAARSDALAILFRPDPKPLGRALCE